MTARRNIIPVFIPHLGCPHDCVFCNQKRISGSLLPACPEDVRRAVENGLGYSAAPPQLAFYGGSFTAMEVQQQTELLEAARPYIESGRLSGLRVSTRPDAIDDETLERLRFYGVDTVELGAQSMVDSVLQKSGRGHLAADTEASSELIKERGFRLILQMMTGLPGASPELDLETAVKIAGLRPDGVRIYPTVVIKDTALYDMYLAGTYREHSVEDAVSTCARIVPVFETAGIPIIRLGLNPTDDLSGGDAVAGAYHPALGELVKSRVLLDRVRQRLGKGGGGGKLVICVKPSQVSQMAGQHRCNIRTIMDEFGFDEVKIQGKELGDGEIELIKVEKAK